MAKLGIGNVPARVVIAVIARREVRSADGQAREGKTQPAIRSSEQLSHDRAPLVVRELAQDLGRSIGHRSAEPVHFLEMLRRVDRDRFVALRRTDRRLFGLRGQFLRLVRGGQPHFRSWFSCPAAAD